MVGVETVLPMAVLEEAVLMLEVKLIPVFATGLHHGFAFVRIDRICTRSVRVFGSVGQWK